MADNVYYDPWSNTKTKNGLDADLVISALQKCIRRGEEELALRMAYELYITSTFHEEKMWNRLLVISVEDIGFGNTEAPVFVKTMNDLRKEFAYGDGDRPIFFMHAIRYLCKCKKERSTDHIKNIIMKEFEQGYVPGSKGNSSKSGGYAYHQGKSHGQRCLLFPERGEQGRTAVGGL